MIEWAYDDVGTFGYVLSTEPNRNGSIVLVDSPTRMGGKSHKCTVSGLEGKRAEVDDHSWTRPKGVYFYGVSYHIPNDTVWDTTDLAIVGQWRFNNQLTGGYTVPNCSMTDCAGLNPRGGTGHHLQIEKNRWVYYLQHQDSGCGPCKGLKEIRFDLGPLDKGVWTDVVMEAKWTPNDDGYLKIWMRTGSGSYVQRLNYVGPTWFDRYQDGSEYWEVFQRLVGEPDFTAGLYASFYDGRVNDARERYLFVDQLRVADNTGGGGFNEVDPGRAATFFPGTGDYYRIKNVETGTYLHVNGTDALLGSVTDNSAQWLITKPTKAEQLVLTNRASGHTLHTQNNKFFPECSAANSTLYMGYRDRWFFTDLGNGQFRLINYEQQNKNAPEQVLSRSANDVTLLAISPTSNAQRWVLEKVTVSTRGPNLVTNPSFEVDGFKDYTPTGWSSWNSAAGDADYCETYGGGHAGSYHGTHYLTAAYQSYTFQVKTGLANGLYTMKAYVKSGGGQNSCRMGVKNYGGTEKSVAIGAAANWTEVTVADVNVTNGQAEFFFWSDAPASKWLYFDSVDFYKQ